MVIEVQKYIKNKEKTFPSVGKNQFVENWGDLNEQMVQI